MKIEIGDKAPEFIAETDGGRTIATADCLGKWLVLYFYPKDDTSGCTKEACSFRDNMERITPMGVEVIGVSPDSAISHDKFKAKYKLNFNLISDPDKAISQNYGVWVEKSMYGKKYMGVERTTFIIDPQGIVRHVFNKVKVDGHVDEIITLLMALKDNQQQ